MSHPLSNLSFSHQSNIKILISSDNHLGYREKDHLRGDDSFRAFHEVLELAKVNKVDMLLLAGDLFHDVKPSLSTLHKTMCLLRQYTAVSKPTISVTAEYNPGVSKPSCENVSLPIFVIHGNHDVPTGGLGEHARSPLDILAAAGLVTYFGRTNRADFMKVTPLLIRKGDTALALYGLGNIPDETLIRTWKEEKKVQIVRANALQDYCTKTKVDKASADTTSWFNIFVLHQNRYTRGYSRAISETLLPEWLHYVVWGHEHASVPTPSRRNPSIVQPGSTVQTSLSESEAGMKHAILLDVCRGKIRKHQPIPLQAVRSFYFRHEILSEQRELEHLGGFGVEKFLKSTVTDLIRKHQISFREKLDQIKAGMHVSSIPEVSYPSHSFYKQLLSGNVSKPLVRLRIEVTGNWERPNPQAFGGSFVEEVANPGEILIYYRKEIQLSKKRSRTFLQGDTTQSLVMEDTEDIDLTRNRANEGAADLHQLIRHFLTNSKGEIDLRFLELDKLSNAVLEFVQERDKRSIQSIQTFMNNFVRSKREKALLLYKANKMKLDEKALEVKFREAALAAALRKPLPFSVPESNPTPRPSRKKQKIITPEEKTVRGNTFSSHEENPGREHAISASGKTTSGSSKRTNDSQKKKLSFSLKSSVPPQELQTLSLPKVLRKQRSGNEKS